MAKKSLKKGKKLASTKTLSGNLVGRRTHTP